MAENQDPANPDEKQIRDNPELEEFFQRLPANLRWPKPSEEAIAAAAEAIQRMAGGVAAAELTSGNSAGSDRPCTGCGGELGFGASFCPHCGLAQQSAGEAGAPPAGRGGTHHYHHHFHHFAPASTGAPPSASPADSQEPRGRAPGSGGTSTGGRAELLARQVAQNWAQACNTRHLDDLVELYSADATLIRSNIPPVRSLPAIREFLHALLEAGLGDLEMESLRLEIMGEIAMEIGRCKMLVPVVMGKRREERGKYLLVMVRQPAGTWKILADCWSSDQAVAAPAAPEPPRKVAEPAAPSRKPR